MTLMEKIKALWNRVLHNTSSTMITSTTGYILKDYRDQPDIACHHTQAQEKRYCSGPDALWDVIDKRAARIAVGYEFV